jgi:hypothetical protein
MKVFLWIIQIALAVLAVAGGAYKIFAFDELAKMPATAALPQFAWAALGAFEVVCGLLLIVPAAMRKRPSLTAPAAAALAVESLVLAGIYARYSLSFAATNPLIWVIVMALMAAFVAYGRRAVR